MAEERLIDDDKNRKYKIVKNADGEDELVIDTSADEEEAFDEVGFEVPELDSDDEEAAVMTPEQLAARDRMRAEAEAKKQEKIKEIAARALSFLDEGKFENAVYVLAEADELGDDGEIYALKLRAVTRDFTDFSAYGDGEESANGVKNFAPKETVEKLSHALPSLKVKAAELKEKTENLNVKNEEEKTKRRVIFVSKRNKSAVLFSVSAAFLIVFAALAIYYGTHLTAVKDGANIPLFITFVSFAGVFFIATVFTSRWLWKNANNLKLNERNSSTKLGREFEEIKAELKFVESLVEIFENHDIS